MELIPRVARERRQPRVVKVSRALAIRAGGRDALAALNDLTRDRMRAQAKKKLASGEFIGLR